MYQSLLLGQRNLTFSAIQRLNLATLLPDSNPEVPLYDSDLLGHLPGQLPKPPGHSLS